MQVRVDGWTRGRREGAKERGSEGRKEPEGWRRKIGIGLKLL